MLIHYVSDLHLEGLQGRHTWLSAGDVESTAGERFDVRPGGADAT